MNNDKKNINSTKTNDKNNFIDVNYKEDIGTKYINGKPVYYTTNQVAQMLNENDSTIRFWCTCFKDFLIIETSGRNRKFKDEDIEKIKFIKKLLRENKLTINQVKEYCSEKNTKTIEKKVKEQNPLALQALASALSIEISNQLKDFKIQLIKQVTDENKNNFTKQNELHQQYKIEIKDFIASTIENTVDDNMQKIENTIVNQEKKAKERDIKMVNILKQNMEERKKENEIKKQKEANKNFWQRLFKK